jgi:hypothetical protein
MKTMLDTDLLYSAEARCPCGAGLAYPLDHKEALAMGAWQCSAALKGIAEGKHVSYPFALYTRSGRRPRSTTTGTQVLAPREPPRSRWGTLSALSAGTSGSPSRTRPVVLDTIGSAVLALSVGMRSGPTGR